MYSIKKQFINFQKTINYNAGLLNYYHSDQKKVYIYYSGVLNNVWQSWNQFWRTIWLAHMLGGEGTTYVITPSHPGLDEASAIYHLKGFLTTNRRQPTGRIQGSHQEPTWGDIKNIQNISIKIPTPGTRVLSTFGALGNAPKHLQMVRNASIHLNKDSMNEVRTILHYYRISKIKYPTDILLAQELSTGKTAIKNWSDELIAFLELVIS